MRVNYTKCVKSDCSVLIPPTARYKTYYGFACDNHRAELRKKAKQEQQGEQMTKTRWQSKRYDYTFENLQRKCGHTETVTIKHSIIAAENKLRESLNREVCTPCRKTEIEQVRAKEANAINYAMKWCTDHLINTDQVSISAYNQGEAVEILICLTVQ